MRRMIGRRDFLKSAALASTGTWLPTFMASPELRAIPREKLPVTAVVTVYHDNSHADVLVGKILEGWQQNGGRGPDLKLVSLYVDQVGEGDMSRALAQKHGFRIARTIDEAITLGTDRVQVAGVISIGEHGDYPLTPDTKQHMYPRRRFFDEIVAAFDRCHKVVPVFNDKHLAYNWDDARFMVDAAQDRNIPFLAGSSLPLTWRFPTLELDRTDEVDSVVSVGYGGLEAYGFHALEMHQAMIERRRGGETGIASVQALRGDDIDRAAEQGRWSVELFQSALKTLPNNVNATSEWTQQENAAMYLMEHRDGLKSAVAMVGGLPPEFAFAAKLKGRAEPVATWLRLQDRKPYAHFAHLLKAIEETIHTNSAVYPVERTLLTTGTLDRLMHSLAENGKAFDTPELDVTYQPSDWPFANHPRTRLVLTEPE